VIREDRFVLSHRPYAVDLGSLTTDRHERQLGDSRGTHYWSGQVGAVWFRKRRGVLVAVVGTLWDYQDQQPFTAEQFLERADDGRYGGTALGRWDGESYWSGCGGRLDVQREHMETLEPMLAAYPELPRGYDGWWVYP
jgi:hypothetical protein